MTPAGKDLDRPLGGFRQREVVVLLVVALAVVCWLVSGFYTVAPNETGIITRFGEFYTKVSPGIHYALPWPIDRVYTPRTEEVQRIEVGFRGLGERYSERRRSDMLTGDENILKIMMVVQYKIRDPVEYLFRVDEPRWLVERAVESAMNQYVARLPVDDVLTDAKNRIQLDTIDIAQKMLDDKYNAGIRLLGGNLQEVSPPVPVIDAFKDVASAKKDSERKIDEAREDAGRIILKATGEARQLISNAEGSAASRIDTARGDTARFLSLLEEYRKAKEVTRTRLYVDAMERILARTKVVILPDEEEAGASKLTVVEQPAG